jgi:pseudo-rSAM protein
VLLEKKDILDKEITMQTIFRNQTLNSMTFGSLSITSNGNVYSNLNKPKLGNIKEAGLDYFIHREYKNGESWFNIRKEEPCLNCHYQWLCPSPSNYELAIGKPNLCHVKP